MFCLRKKNSIDMVIMAVLEPKCARGAHREGWRDQAYMGCCCITATHIHKRTRVKPAFYHHNVHTYKRAQPMKTK